MLDPTTIRQCASYHSLEAHPAYAGNPLIEALPPIASEGVVTTHLRNHPPPPTTRQRALLGVVTQAADHRQRVEVAHAAFTAGGGGSG